MRFLIDNALSPVFAVHLVVAGHDAIHLRSLGMQDASDDVVFELAHDQDRVLVSADTDFGTLLALRGQRSQRKKSFTSASSLLRVLPSVFPCLRGEPHLSPLPS